MQKVLTQQVGSGWDSFSGFYAFTVGIGKLINESTAGADASVEMPKLHNIKLLLIAFMHMIKTI